MSQPKHEAPKTENAGPAEQKFTVVVYDQSGRTVLFRQVAGRSAIGVINQMETEFTRGNRDYGLDTTDHKQQPDFDPGVSPLEMECWEDECSYTGLPTSVAAHWVRKHPSALLTFDPKDPA